MNNQTQSSTEQFEYKAEMKQLLNIIIHSLYKNPEVFLREIVSNASDALNKLRFRRLTDSNIVDPEAELKIMINADKEKQTFSIEDTGIGMTKDDLITQIGTVASSGTLQFLKNLQEEKKTLDASMIGQFGVGFYSIFMVTDEITIETRHADPDSKAYRWTSQGQDKFTIEEIDRKERGTKIFFKLKDENKEFAEDYVIKNTLKKYSNFVDFPLFVGDEKVNTVQALWHKKKDEIKDEELDEFYKFISNDYQKPLGHIHVSIEGTVNFKALLFIPEYAPPNLFMDSQEKGLHLYSSKVFIQDDAKELMPDYLRFVKGVVDTEDLPLNVSREVTQSSPVMAKIRNVLTGKILSLLEEWAEKDNEKFEKFFKNFGAMFKTGVNTDFSNKERLLELLRFESSELEEGELSSLSAYVSRMNTDQKEIYYLSGDTRESILRNPNLEYFRKNNIEVLLLSDPVDVFVVPYLQEYDKKPLKSIEKADIDLAKTETEEEKKERLGEDATKSLVEVFKETLGDKVEDVVESKRLVESPVTLVVGNQGLDAQMEKMMQFMDKQHTLSKRILEINTGHPIIKNLSRLNISDSKDPFLRDAITQLFEGALLTEGYLKSPTEFIARMHEFIEKATEK